MFTVHLIETMGQGTTLANQVKEFTFQADKSLFHEETLVIGKSLGQLFAFALDI